MSPFGQKATICKLHYARRLLDHNIVSYWDKIMFHLIAFELSPPRTSAAKKRLTSIGSAVNFALTRLVFEAPQVCEQDELNN